jgi:hypothetical protein
MVQILAVGSAPFGSAQGAGACRWLSVVEANISLAPLLLAPLRGRTPCRWLRTLRLRSGGGHLAVGSAPFDSAQGADASFGSAFPGGRRGYGVAFHPHGVRIAVGVDGSTAGVLGMRKIQSTGCDVAGDVTDCCL